MKYSKSWLLLSALPLVFSSCENNPLLEKEEADYSIEESFPSFEEMDGEGEVTASTSQEVIKAFCVVKPKNGSKVVGAVSFKQESDGVRIVADIGGLAPGKHGFHVHEHGDCSAADATSAGGHFNPTNKSHGGPDSQERHVGDLGNLEANEYGFAHYDRVDTVIELNGPNSIVGKSIVVHEGEDDLKTQPTGNSGSRIGCGEIHSAVK